MNTQRISAMVNELFDDVIENDKVREQKEEILTHLTERVADYMAEGFSFDDALERAKNDLGDLGELLNGFERKATFEFNDDIHFHVDVRNSWSNVWNSAWVKLASLAPFIYVIIGIAWSFWVPEWWEWRHWWWWGWVIIPVIPIIGSGKNILRKIPALAPFIWFLLGIFLGGRWWLWGLLIIPISGILFSGGKKKKKKKSKVVHEDGSIYIEKPGKKIRIDNQNGTIDIEKEGKRIKINNLTGGIEIIKDEDS